MSTGARHVWVAAVALLAVGTSLEGQGTTTAEIHGTVRVSSGAPVEGARVTVIHRPTGGAVETLVRHGRFLVGGLEVGGPYSVRVRRLGSAPQERTDIYLAIGQRLDLDFVLADAASLDTVRVVAGDKLIASPAGAGTGGAITDTLLHRLPTLNRDLFDFARLVPQVVGQTNSVSGAGVATRYNSYLIDGVSTRQLEGNNVPGGTLGKAITLEAVKEYQVLLAPYDPRYGDFAGVMVNAVTRGGTDQLHGTVFGFGRNEQLARETPFLRDTPFDREQFGISLDGPIVRGRAHFLVAAEAQRSRQPARGPYFGRATALGAAPPVSAADVDRFVTLLRGYSVDAGSAGRVTISQPSVNLFGRVDIALPEIRSRAVVRHNYADFGGTQFNRPEATASFSLSSAASTLEATRQTAALQLFTQLARGASNEFLFGYTTHPFGNMPEIIAPRIQVNVPRVTGPGFAVLIAGPADVAQGTRRRQRSIEIGDHLTVHPAATHALTVGARVEAFSYNRTAVEGGWGTWTFASLDALTRGQATTFSVSKDFGSATAAVRGTQVSAYVGDQWDATERLSFTLGVRAELLSLDGRPQYSAAVDSLFHRRTDDFPRPRVQWAPRAGFTLALDDAASSRVRGGAGVFSTRPPLIWYLFALRSDGVRSLSCSGGTAPTFSPDVTSPPAICTNGRSFGNGAVFHTTRDLEMPRVFRSSLAYDRLLPWKVNATFEGLYTRALSNLFLDNLRLAGPRTVDRHGRVLYGQIDASGAAAPALVSTSYPEAFELRNHSSGHSTVLSATLAKRFGNRFEGTVSYARSWATDVETLTPESGPASAWQRSRFVSDRHDDARAVATTGAPPHRVVLAATWDAPWRRWLTSVSLYYIGESGAPFTFGDSAVGSLGDLNADGTNANDPVYIPRSASDTSEIVFGGTPDDVTRQQVALDRFIERTECLRRQRGRIVERNSCRGPWVHTSNLSLRQRLPSVGAHEVSLQLEAFNLLNLLRNDWGLLRVPNTNLLQHVGQTPGPTGASQPIFRFDEHRLDDTTLNLESGYQLQLALRYRF